MISSKKKIDLSVLLGAKTMTFPKKKIDLSDEQKEGVLFFNSSTIKIEHLLERMITAFSSKGFDQLVQIITSMGGIPINSRSWFHDGVQCELLEPGKYWKKGKVKIKIVLEFESDEIEEDTNLKVLDAQSPLDEIRREMKDI